ncbi:MAG: hypothetical protein DRH57_02155 [Candidatus Cloacimonadota bacterium]|nr:MAG: hypothetical protein DRH57_02155 [Candidatus Cloacimonadota bacterium]
MSNKILIHICCAPCLIAPYDNLIRQNFQVMGFWYNPNIHPYTEYKRRLHEVKRFSENHNFNIIYKDNYKLEEFLRNVVFRENNRCQYCYYDRLLNTAIYARRGKFDYFTTTLLYSKFQNHKQIIDIAQSLANKYGVKFYYQDFRKLWKEGIELSKSEKMYRQQYCGCIYSERDRYLGKKSVGRNA